MNRTTLAWVFLILLGVRHAAACASPPFRIQQRDSVWQLLTPAGKPTFSLGVCCVNMGAAREKYDPSKPEYAAWREYADPGAWADATLSRLRSWGFTTIGGWSDYATLRRSPQMDMPFAPVLHLGASSGAPWFDMWDPKVIGQMDAVAREQIIPIRDDPRLLGYYTDNETGWWNAALFKLTLEQPASSGQRQRLTRLLRDHYHGRWDHLTRDFEPVGVESFSQLDRSGMLFLRPGGDGIRPMRQFLELAARRYYRIVREIIRRYDRRGLIFGDRYQSFYYPEVARAAGPCLDAVSTNLNASWNDGTFPRFYLDTLYRLSHRPVMVGEFYMTATENRSGNRNDSSGFPVVATQRQRAVAFRTTLTALLRTPSIIGADWFQYYDEPAHGRPDGEDYDMGLVDTNDQPYREITAAAASLDQLQLRRSPEVRRPDATSGVPHAPPEPMAELHPMKILQSWDRERGFVPPVSTFPVADLYLCWAPDALYLGLYAIDPEETTYYRDGQLPEADRIEWTLRLPGRSDPLRVHLGSGRPPTVTDRRVTVVCPSRDGDVRTVAIVRLPAALWGRAGLNQNDRLTFASTLLTHARAYRVEWKGTFRLAN